MTRFAPQTSSGHGRVLIAEPPSVYREMQSLLLRRASYEVLTCDDPRAATSVAAQQRCDVVVLDQPDDKPVSPEFVTALRKDSPEVAVLVVAAVPAACLSAELERLGASAVLQRPVGPDVLMRKIDEILAGRRRPSAPGTLHADPARPSLGDSR